MAFENFSCGTQRVIPSGQDSAILLNAREMGAIEGDAFLPLIPE